MASNFNSGATHNDGTCIYPNASIVPVSLWNLDSVLTETSGLVFWNHQLWTHNDNGVTNVYSLDTIDGTILQVYPINGVVNVDWEEIAQDDNYFYVGDFGNNTNGNRIDLKILRIEKNSVLNNAPVVDTISFAYSDQSNFTPTGANNTDYDCEAFIVSTDSIYLFTKQWVTNRTRIYALGKTPGNHSATFMDELNVAGMITGATFLEQQRLIVLSGYSNLLQPFIYLLYDFSGNDFFNGNKRKISISMSFHQVEGIASSDGLKYYISNEYFSNPPLPIVQQKLHILDLSTFLLHYLNKLTLDIPKLTDRQKILVYPNPSEEFIIVKAEESFYPLKYSIVNQVGQLISAGELANASSVIDIQAIPAGLYWFGSMGYRQQFVKIQN
ncbi:MAG: T9SS type A sorting domain-containing protein [Bacteroidia bacterium]|nr:T9SS type A sorting domain-containing protein [Bacteroidia bacterium]